MSENEAVIESGEVLNIDSIIEDEVVELSAQEILSEDNTKTKNNDFIKGLLVGVVDQIVVVAVALVIFLLFTLIIKMFGYQVVEKETIFLITYVISNIIYVSVCKKLKFETTVGRKIVIKK